MTARGIIAASYQHLSINIDINCRAAARRLAASAAAAAGILARGAHSIA